MKNIGFVLLHYNNIEVTHNSIDYILRLNRERSNISIIIVDNASPNESGKRLEEEYENNPLIQVILSDKNLGFAKGNNLGYCYLKEKKEFDYIVVMNTDVYITDLEFLNKLQNIKSNVQVIGPDILTPQNNHQNPLRLYPMRDGLVKKLYRYNNCMAKLYRIPLLGSIAMELLEMKNAKVVKNNKIYENKDMYDVVLHGACIIFTKEWIREEEVAFLPSTFMYVEEDILEEYVREKGYHTLFTPTIQVLHMEDASLNGSFRSRLKKRQFLADNMSFSAKVLINMRKNS